MLITIIKLLLLKKLRLDLPVKKILEVRAEPRLLKAYMKDKSKEKNNNKCKCIHHNNRMCHPHILRDKMRDKSPLKYNNHKVNQKQNTIKILKYCPSRKNNLILLTYQVAHPNRELVSLTFNLSISMVKLLCWRREIPNIECDNKTLNNNIFLILMKKMENLKLCL